ncbi:MAG: NUDIX hydrolase [Solobacterium sp.]|nr:NUDIX hydrolase [Solobacterium sp.]
MDKMIEWAKELQSLAQAGLYYNDDVFNKERYQRIRDISFEMMAEHTGNSFQQVKEVYCKDIGYQTPKIDTRAVIIENDKILLVQEQSGRWSIPGGWCEYNLTPAENVVKEAKEETGLDVIADRLIAVLDRDRYSEPPYPFKVIKMFFLCHSVGGSFVKNIETTKSGYFSLEELPEIAKEKISEEQIRMCFDAYQDKDRTVRFE